MAHAAYKFLARDRDPLWNDFHWQSTHRITHAGALREYCTLTQEEELALEKADGAFGWGITPYYASLIDPSDPRCPIRLQCVPRLQEAHVGPTDLVDPLGEDPKMPVAHLVHRYPDRVLLLTTDRCSVYCRYCTRNRLVSIEQRQISTDELRAITDYLSAHPDVREVIVSGGDPLISGDRFLHQVLSALRGVPTIKLLRIHTRMPVVCPMRITPALVNTLREFHPLYVVTHFNHPRELTTEAAQALTLLADGGIPLANQTVLLAGVNDTPAIIEDLCVRLLENRVRPYYLHQTDLASGTEHFRTPVDRGLAIMDFLRGRLSGTGIPTFVIDLPGGKGKVPLVPDYVLESAPGRIHFRAPLGGEATYTDPMKENVS